MKLKSLKVENFKSLEKTEIELFEDKNLFYGFNNSGKSNVFKFLDLLFKSKEIRVPIDFGEELESQEFTVDPKDFWQGEIYDEPFLFTKNERSKPIIFEVEISIPNPVLKEIGKGALESNGFIGVDNTHVQLKGKIIAKDMSTSIIELEEAKCNDLIFYTYSDQIVTFFPGLKGQQNLDRVTAEAILRLLTNCILYIGTERNFRKELFDTMRGELGPDNFKNWLFDLNINSDKYDKFLDLVKFLKSFDFSKESKSKLNFSLNSFPFGEGTDIGFTKFKNEVEIMLRNENGRFPLSNYGTGIQQFFYLMSLIYWSNRRIIIIEELELNLSPLYQLEILKFLSELMTSNFYDQLLFSTHSPFFTQENNKMVDVVHLVQLLDKGTEVWSYDNPKDRKEFYDEGSDVKLFSMMYS